MKGVLLLNQRDVLYFMERAWLHVFRIAFVLYCICSVNTVHSMKIFCIHGRDLPECAVRNNHCEEYSQCNFLGLTFNHGTWACKLINYQYNIIPQFLFFLQTIYCNSPVLWGRSRGTQLLVINFLKPFPCYTISNENCWKAPLQKRSCNSVYSYVDLSGM